MVICFGWRNLRGAYVPLRRSRRVPCPKRSPRLALAERSAGRPGPGSRGRPRGRGGLESAELCDAVPRRTCHHDSRSWSGARAAPGLAAAGGRGVPEDSSVELEEGRASDAEPRGDDPGELDPGGPRGPCVSRTSWGRESMPHPGGTTQQGGASRVSWLCDRTCAGAAAVPVSGPEMPPGAEVGATVPLVCTGTPSSSVNSCPGGAFAGSAHRAC